MYESQSDGAQPSPPRNAPRPSWLAALIVGAALLAVAGVAALIGKGRLQQATPPVPKRTVSSVKTDVEEIKERAWR